MRSWMLLLSKLHVCFSLEKVFPSWFMVLNAAMCTFHMFHYCHLLALLAENEMNSEFHLALRAVDCEQKCRGSCFVCSLFLKWKWKFFYSTQNTIRKKLQKYFFLSLALARSLALSLICRSTFNGIHGWQNHLNEWNHKYGARL